MTSRVRSRRSVAGVAWWLGVSVACVQPQALPASPLGPSELALSLTASAIPDVLPLDGRSRSTVDVWARDAFGVPVSGVTLMVQTSSDATFLDVGELSSRRLVTGPDGTARAIYTAPLRGALGGSAPDNGEVVTLWFTPVGGDFANAVARSLTIRVVPAGKVIPPFDVDPDFGVTPDDARVFSSVVFSARCTRGATERCVRDPVGIITTYAWQFGDGETGSGAAVSHTYTRPGLYLVTLTVRDDSGRAAEATQAIRIAEGVPPEAVMTVSPAVVQVGAPAFFNARGSRADGERILTSFAWDFGDGGSGAGVTTSHAYGREGTYAVTLTVMDDQGQAGTTTTTVDVMTADGMADESG